MNKVLLILSFSCFLALITAQSQGISEELMMNGETKEVFKVWQRQFNKPKASSASEKKEKFQAFESNLQFIREENAKNNSYQLGLNQFADMSLNEFKEKMCTMKENNKEEIQRMISTLTIDTTKFLEEADDSKRVLQKQAVDHRRHFGRVRQQGQCGSCWAFSTVGAVEGVLSMKSGKTEGWFSTQQLVDCDNRNGGCQGGYPNYALDYIKQNGLMLEQNYPYRMQKYYCQFNPGYVAARIRGYDYCYNGYAKQCTAQNFHALLQQGPLSVVIFAGNQVFQNYRGGLYNLDCRMNHADHAVVLVGYGVSAEGEYWLIRNSFDATWGEQGHMRVKVNDANQYSCWVQTQAWLPLV